MVRDRITPEGERFYAMLRELAGKEVRIGFQAGEATDENGVDMCDIAAWNELGTENIPARPFLRQSSDEHQYEIKAFSARAAKEMIHGGTAEQCLDKIGVKMKGIVQKTIRDGDFVPNAPSTVRRKGSSKPLIDTGRMRQSVNYVIRRKGESGE